MKIVVTVVESSKGTQHRINVVDGKDIVHSSVASTIKERDKIIWNLADLYDTVEINIKSAKEQSSDFKYSEIPNIPVLDEVQDTNPVNLTTCSTLSKESISLLSADRIDNPHCLACN